MLSCRDVVVLADRLLDRDLTWRERMALRMHLAMCRHCGAYERQLRLLLRGLERLHFPASEDEVRHIIERVERNQPHGEPDE